MMRRALQSIAVCFPILLTACSNTQSENPITLLAEPRIKSVALASIVAKYPNVKTSDWLFERASVVAPSNGGPMIEAVYSLPSSAEQKEQKTPTEHRLAVKMKGVRVMMSASGKVREVSEVIVTSVLATKTGE